MIMISGAIITYGIVQYRTKSVGFTGIILAVITGFFIACYSIVDAEGTRITESAISYYGASTTANAVLFALYLLCFQLLEFWKKFSNRLEQQGWENFRCS